MAIKFKLKYIIGILLFSLMLTSCRLFTIVPIEENDSQKGSKISSGEKAVDVNKYIEDKWDSVIVKEINERKQSLTKILSEASGGWDEVCSKYGIKKGDIGSKYNFIVTDTAQVKEVNTESKAGFIVISLNGVNTDYTLKIAIGPVLKGTAIRDSLKGINFNDFVNQMDYANLANELNKKGNENSVGNIDVNTLNGKTITFTGSFTDPEGAKEIIIMPIFMEVK